MAVLWRSECDGCAGVKWRCVYVLKCVSACILPCDFCPFQTHAVCLHSDANKCSVSALGCGSSALFLRLHADKCSVSAHPESSERSPSRPCRAAPTKPPPLHGSAVPSPASAPKCRRGRPTRRWNTDGVGKRVAKNVNETFYVNETCTSAVDKGVSQGCVMLRHHRSPDSALSGGSLEHRWHRNARLSFTTQNMHARSDLRSKGNTARSSAKMLSSRSVRVEDAGFGIEDRGT